MRIFFLLAIFAVVFKISTSAYAQEWEYDEKTDPFTDEIIGAGVMAENLDGFIGVLCVEEFGMMVRVIFKNVALAPGLHPATIKWRINEGEVIKFKTAFSGYPGYAVMAPKSVELARMLVDAEQFITSDGGEGLWQETLEFNRLSGGSRINRVLRHCGYRDHDVESDDRSQLGAKGPDPELVPPQRRKNRQVGIEETPPDMFEDIASFLGNLPPANWKSQPGKQGNVASDRLQSLFKSQLRKCWFIAPESAASGKIVRIRIHLRPDGFLMRPPELLASETELNQDHRYRSMADAARRAVLNCEPFQIPPELYFEEFIFDFNPGQVNLE